MFSAVLPILIVLFCMFFNFGIKHMGPVLVSSINWVVVLNPLCVIFLVVPYRESILGKKKKLMIRPTLIKWKNSMFKNNIAPSLEVNVEMNGLEPISGTTKVWILLVFVEIFNFNKILLQLRKKWYNMQIELWGPHVHKLPLPQMDL